MGVNDVSSDIVYTPSDVARRVVEHFKPQGSILDPCAGEGAFTAFMPSADWCEITKGRDFYDYDGHVDWIVSNPPYSIFSDFLRHSFKIADNIVYLIPANKVFNSDKMMRDIAAWGGVKEMFVIGPGSRLKFPIGFCIAAVHFQKGYTGDMKITYMEDIKMANKPFHTKSIEESDDETIITHDFNISVRLQPVDLALIIAIIVLISVFVFAMLWVF